VHWSDAATAVEETMRALDEVGASGRVRFVDASARLAFGSTSPCYLSDMS
jgi:aryl-alcohol dehydrogenase-like predicted oxidoreductase